MEIIKLHASKKENQVVILLKGFGFANANILRRYMKDYVPTMAIEDVVFYKNSSALYDEIIAHRLGLIVLKTDLSSYTLKQECTCNGEGCAKCTLKITLSAKGPRMVYAEDLVSKDKKVVPVYPKTPLVKLTEGQELECEATAILGRGYEHAKWSPGHIYYKAYPQVVMGKNANPDAVVKKYPKVFTLSGKTLKIADPLLVSEAVEEFCSEHDITISHDSDDIIMVIESFGQLSHKEMLSQAIQQFTEQVKALQEAL
ncbi:MAG: DNA-directed RNA polymerase subunit D [Candidatus Woesearchaeota archaeon]